MSSIFSDVAYWKSTLRQTRRKIYRILTSKKLIARGFVYLVEWEGKFYLLVNTNDLEIAIAKLPSKSIEQLNLDNRIMDIPCEENEELVGKVSTGLFAWASKL